jgi:hypothetical protein
MPETTDKNERARSETGPSGELAGRARSETGPSGNFVSCIMPTRGRRAWVPLALRCWQEQDWPAFARELIVVDDGPEPVGDLCAGAARVRYVHLAGHNSIGAKLNLGCELATGDVLAAWSDDDYHAPHRLAYQLQELERSGAAVCGTDCLHYWDVLRQEAWRYEWAIGTRSNGYVTGGTMMWRRAFWERGASTPSTPAARTRAGSADEGRCWGRWRWTSTWRRSTGATRGTRIWPCWRPARTGRGRRGRQSRGIAPAWWLAGAREAAQ